MFFYKNLYSPDLSCLVSHENSQENHLPNYNRGVTHLFQEENVNILQSKLMDWRIGLLLAGAVCGVLLGYAFFAQYAQHLIPCLLCLAQRVVFAVFGVSCLVLAFVGGIRWLRWFAVIWLTLVGAAGLGLAGRHVWLQTHPGQSLSSCYEDLKGLFEDLPLKRAIDSLLAGSPSCEKIDWLFLGLTMSQWTFLCFVGLIVWVWLLAFKRSKTSVS